MSHDLQTNLYTERVGLIRSTSEMAQSHNGFGRRTVELRSKRGTSVHIEIATPLPSMLNPQTTAGPPGPIGRDVVSMDAQKRAHPPTLVILYRDNPEGADMATWWSRRHSRRPKRQRLPSPLAAATRRGSGIPPNQTSMGASHATRPGGAMQAAWMKRLGIKTQIIGLATASVVCFKPEK